MHHTSGPGAPAKARAFGARLGLGKPRPRPWRGLGEAAVRREAREGLQLAGGPGGPDFLRRAGVGGDLTTQIGAKHRVFARFIFFF